ncbi:hypothetical protein [Vibrio parahaemolyticus]|uniref:hypothetical protein n=1 Tax=Vibrio parahaemolyticus TaxID=670 RepID=UPI0031CC41D5
MNRESLLHSISGEVLIATELFMDNMSTVQLNGSCNKVNVQDLVEDIVILSSFQAFTISDDTLKKSFIEFINDSTLNSAYQESSSGNDPLLGMNHDVFRNLALKYNHFNDVKPRFHDELFENSFDSGIELKDASLIQKHFSGKSEFNKLHPLLRRSMLPTQMVRSFETTGNSYFLLYIDCILRYINVRYLEYAEACARKIGIATQKRKENH